MYKLEDIKKLPSYTEGIEKNPNIFTETGTGKDELGLGGDKIDKATLLAQMRARELQLDRLKQMPGYRGTPRTDYSKQSQNTEEQGTQEPAKVSNSTSLSEPVNPHQEATKAWDGILKLSDLAMPKQPSDANATTISEQGTIGDTSYENVSKGSIYAKDISAIAAKKQAAEEELRNPVVPPSRKKYLEEQLSNIEKNFGADIVNQNFKDKASSIKAFDVDKETQSLILPPQTSNISNLDSNFMSSLHSIVQYEKQHGTLKPDITDQQILDGVMGSRYVFHDIAGDEYSDLRRKYPDFFNGYKEKREQLSTLHNEFLKNGGYKQMPPEQAVTNEVQNTTGQSPKLKGVRVPFSALNWGDASTRPVEDLFQGASNVTFEPLGKVLSALEGYAGASYQTQREQQEKTNVIGSTLARTGAAVVNMVPAITKTDTWNPIQAIGDIGNRSGWNQLMNDIGAMNFYAAPTSLATKNAADALALPDQKEVIKPLDNPWRDIIQGGAEMAMSIGFGEFSAASKLSTGIGRGASRLTGIGRNFDEATLIANRVQEELGSLAQYGKIGEATTFGEVVNGTNEGRKAIALAKYMLPPNASTEEAAHLASTLAIQHVAQHVDNLSADDIRDGVKTGTIFALSNLGISKFMGPIARGLSGLGNTGKMAPEIAEKIQTYQRWANVASQMAGNPVQTVISKAVDSGDIASIIDPSSYANRQAATDLFMGMFGLKDAYHAAKEGKEARIENVKRYENLIKNIAEGKASIYDIPKDIQEATKEPAKEQVPEQVERGTQTAPVEIKETKQEQVPLEKAPNILDNTPPKTEFGTDVIEPENNHKSIFEMLGEDKSIKNLAKVFEETATDPLEQKVAKIIAPMLSEHKGKYILKDIAEIEKGKAVPGYYSEDTDNISFSTHKVYNPTPEYTRGTIAEELFHAVGNKAIGTITKGENGEVRDTGDPLFRTKLQEVMRETVKYKHILENFHDDPSEAREYANYHLNEDIGNEADNFRNEKEFAAGVFNRNTKLAEMMDTIPVDVSSTGVKETLWDKFKQLFTSKVKTKASRTLLDQYMDALKSMPVASKESQNNFGALNTEAASLRYIGERIGGKKLVDFDLLDQENQDNLRVIKEHVLSKAKPYELLHTAIAGAKEEYEANLERELKEKGTSVSLEKGLSYDNLSGREKIKAVAEALIRESTSNPEQIATNILEMSKLRAVVNPDDNNYQEYFHEPEKVVDLAMTVSNIPNSKMFGRVINDIMQQGHEGYKTTMKDWGDRLSKLSDRPDEAKANWDILSRKMWKNNHNEQAITPVRLDTKQGTLLPLETDRTKQGTRVNRKRQSLDNFKNFQMQVEKDKALSYYQNEASQVLLDNVAKIKDVYNIQETDGRDGFEPRDTEALLKTAQTVFEKTGIFILPKGADGNIAMDFSKTKEFILGDRYQPGSKYIRKMNDLHNANVWRALESERTWKDAVAGERFGGLPRVIDLSKLHREINLKGKTFETLKADDIIKSDVKESGFFINSNGEEVPVQKYYDKFEENKPRLSAISDKLRTFYTNVHSEQFLPFALRYKNTPEDAKKMRNDAPAELMNIINAYVHNMTDGGAVQYETTGLNKLPKYSEKYLALLFAPYQHYKAWEDVQVGIGDKYTETTDNDLKSIYKVHTRDNGTKYTKTAVLDAELLPDGHILKTLFGKASTDGAIFMFHEKPWQFLRDYVQAPEAGHIKLAHANYDDGFTTLHKGDNHYIPINHYKELARTNPDLQRYLEPLFRVADNLEQQGIFALAMNTTLKGTSYNPKESNGFIYDAQRKVIGIKKKDGSVETKQELLDAANLGTISSILEGTEAIPGHAIMELDLHGPSAVSIVNSSSPSSRTVSPGIDMHNHPRSVIYSEYAQATRSHFDTFLNSKIENYRNANLGYTKLNEFFNSINGESAAIEHSETDLRQMGTFLQSLYDTAVAQEEGAYSKLGASGEVSKAIAKAIDADGKAMVQHIPALMLHKSLFIERGEKGTLAEMAIRNGIEEAWKGNSIGATATLMPDLTAYADHKFLMQELERKEFTNMQKMVNNTANYDAINDSWYQLMGDAPKPSNPDDIARIFAHARVTEKYGQMAGELVNSHIDLETGTYKDKGQGVTLSYDNYEKLNRRLQRDGLPELTLGSKIFAKVTPSDEIDSLVPVYLMGLTPTENTVAINKDWAVRVAGKDNDGDTMGIIAPSRDWFDSDGTDHFVQLHEKLSQMAVHTGAQKGKDGQEQVMKAVNKVMGNTSAANSMITLADGSTAKSVNLALSPIEPGYLKANYHSLRDIGIEVQKVNTVTQAFQNVEGKMEETNIPGRKTLSVKAGDGTMNLVYDPELQRNISIFKQLGAVDMYVPHTVDTDDLMYGTYIQSVNLRGKEIKWSELEDKQKADVKKAFDAWAENTSGGNLIKFKDYTNDVEGTNKLNADLQKHTSSVDSPQGSYSKVLRAMGDGSMIPRKFDEGTLHSSIDNGLKSVENTVNGDGKQIYKPLYNRAAELVTSLRGTLAPLVGRYKSEPKRTFYQTGQVQTKVAMATKLYYDFKNADYSGSVPMQTIASDVILSKQDANGAYLQVSGEKFHLKDIIKEDGTFNEKFSRAIKSVGSDESIVFDERVRGAVSTVPLSRRESDHVIGMVIANAAKALENNSNRAEAPNADSIAGLFLTTQANTVFDGKGSYDGTLINFKNTKVTNADGDSMTILDAAEANGVMPILPDGRRLRDVIEQSAASYGQQLASNNNTYGSLWAAKRNLDSFVKDLNLSEDESDMTKPENLERALTKYKSKLQNMYGDKIDEKQLEEVLGTISPTLFADYMEGGKRSGNAEGVKTNFAHALTYLSIGMDNIAEAVRRNKSPESIGTKIRNYIDSVNPIQLNTRTQLINRLSEKQKAYPDNHVFSIAVPIENGVAGVAPIHISDTFNEKTINPNGIGIYSTDFVEHVMPHMEFTDQANNNLTRLTQLNLLTNKVSAAPDMNALIEAMDTGQIQVPELRFVTKSNGVAKNEIDLIIDGNQLDTSSPQFFTKLKDIISKIYLGTTHTGEAFSKTGELRKYSRNYDEATPLQDRRLFATEVFPDKSGRNAYSNANEFVQGEAWVRAYKTADEMNEPIYLHDVPQKQWYRKNPNEDALQPVDVNEVEHADAIKGIVANDRFHITSKMEEKFNAPEHHDTIKGLFEQYGKDKDTARVEEIGDMVPFEEKEGLTGGLVGKEKGIQDALLHVITSKIAAHRTAMALQTAQGHTEFYASNKSMPESLQQYKDKSVRNLSTTIKELSNADLRLSIRDMSDVDPKYMVSAYSAIDNFINNASEDRVALSNFTHSLLRLGEQPDNVVPGSDEANKQLARAHSALLQAKDELAKMVGQKTKSMVWRDENSKKAAVDKDKLYTTADVLEALGLHKFLTINKENAFNRYRDYIQGSMGTFDELTKGMYMLSPEKNEVAHTNILAALSTRLQRGELDQNNEDISAWTGDSQKAFASGLEHYSPIDTGTKLRAMYKDNSGETQVTSGVMLGIIPMAVKTTNADGAKTSTGRTIPMAVLGNMEGDGVKLIRTDQLQAVRSIVNHVDKTEYRSFQRQVARSPELKRLMDEIRSTIEVTEETNPYSDRTFQTATGITQRQATDVINELKNLSEESKGFLKQWRDNGNKMAVMGSYMQLNQLGGIFGGAIAGGIEGYGKGNWLGAAGGIFKGMAYGIGSLYGRAGGTILDNFVSAPSAMTTMKPMMLWTSAWKMATSETGYKGAMHGLSNVEHDNEVSELTALTTEARLQQHGAGQIAAESGLTAYNIGQFAELSNPWRYKAGRDQVEAMKNTEKEIKKQLSKQLGTNLGIRDLTQEAINLGIKHVMENTLRVHYIDGDIKVTHEGKDIDAIDDLRLKALNMLGATASGYILPWSEVQGAKMTGKLNTNYAKENSNWDDMPAVQQAKYLQALNNLTIGAYGDINFKRKTSDFARLSTLYQTFSAGKFAYKTEGLFERKMMVDALEGTFSKQGVKIWDREDTIVNGVRNADPNKQILYYAGNGVVASIARWKINSLLGSAAIGITLGAFTDKNKDNPLQLVADKMLSTIFNGTNLIGDALGTMLVSIIVGLSPDSWAKNKNGSVSPSTATAREMNLSRAEKQIMRSIPSGQGNNALISVPILATELTKSLVDKRESGIFAKAEKQGLKDLSLQTALDLTKTNPYTSILTPGIVTYQQLSREK